MASLLSKCNRFGHLSQEMMLMSTDYLPCDDKFKLVDVFSPVISQIDTFDTRKYSFPHIKVDDNAARTESGIELFHKLTKVKKIVIPNDLNGIGESLVDSISKWQQKHSIFCHCTCLYA